MESATCWQSSILRLLTITWAPCWASRRAMASPMPRLAPVTRATLPSRSNSWVFCMGLSLSRIGFAGQSTAGTGACQPADQGYQVACWQGIKKPEPGSGFRGRGRSDREQLAQLQGQHHVAFGAQLATHEGLHAVGLAGNHATEGFGIHDQGHVRSLCIAFGDVAGTVLDHGVEVGIILDVELESQVQAGSGCRVEL